MVKMKMLTPCTLSVKIDTGSPPIDVYTSVTIEVAMTGPRGEVRSESSVTHEPTEVNSADRDSNVTNSETKVQYTLTTVP
mmetsp:Transcript_59654/g.128520  ORF Transcript_59654/g.128520 Transcript_59654/m.128520 type:complete len:80 (-) Transcript_59654:46-285(-)